MRWRPDFRSGFHDRRDAGERLATVLLGMDIVDPVVLGLARGGVAVAAPIAQRFGVELHAFIALKIGAPGQPEFAIGAVAEGLGRNPDVVNVERVSMDRVETNEKVIDLRVPDIEKQIRERQSLYRTSSPLPLIKGRTVVIVDDGIATGHTARAACDAIAADEPERLVVAVPVTTRSALRTFTDVEIVALRRPESFRTVGQFYDSFDQLSDEEVIELVEAGRAAPTIP